MNGEHDLSVEIDNLAPEQYNEKCGVFGVYVRTPLNMPESSLKEYSVAYAANDDSCPTCRMWSKPHTLCTTEWLVCSTVARKVRVWCQ